VGPAHAVDEQDGVEGYERRRGERRAVEAFRAAPGERGEAEARCHREALERPHPDRRAERHQTDRQQGEQRPVGALDVLDADVGQQRVGGDVLGSVAIGVEAVHEVQAGVGEVGEGVAGEDRRRGEQREVEHDDRPDGVRGAQRVGERDHGEVAAKAGQHQQAERRRAGSGGDSGQRRGEPAGNRRDRGVPVDQERGGGGGAEGHGEKGGEQPG
jgi:hypothetical protein